MNVNYANNPEYDNTLNISWYLEIRLRCLLNHLGELGVLYYKNLQIQIKNVDEVIQRKFSTFCVNII